jgi:hypothetical protein
VNLHLRPLRRKLGRFLTLNLSKSGPSVTAKLGPASTNTRTRRLRVALGRPCTGCPSGADEKRCNPTSRPPQMTAGESRRGLEGP